LTLSITERSIAALLALVEPSTEVEDAATRTVRTQRDTRDRVKSDAMLPKIRITEGVRSTITPDGAILMDIKGGQMITLNPVGSIIWQGLAEGRSQEQIAIGLAAEFGVPAEQTLADVREFLEQLHIKKLIRASETGSSQPAMGGPKPTGFLCNLFGKWGAEAADRRSK
jgi:hypothetical protein